MVFHWSLNDRKARQVSGTLLSILVDPNNAVVWMVSTHPPTFKSLSPFNDSLVTVPKAPIMIDKIVIFLFYIFSILLQGWGTNPSVNFFTVLFCGQPGKQSPQFW